MDRFSFCQGYDDTVCCFATANPRIGQKAIIAAKLNASRCVFYDPQRMEQAFTNARAKGAITSALRLFKESDREDVYNAALAKVPESERARIETAIKKPRRTKEFLESRKQARLNPEENGRARNSTSSAAASKSKGPKLAETSTETSKSDSSDEAE